MTEDHTTQHLTLIVDGGYLFRALRDILRRPPDTYERADLERIKRYAAAMRPGGYFVAARYFDRRQLSADPFYAALQRMGYSLTLTGSEAQDLPRVPQKNITAELESLRATDDDLLYVGGYSYSGYVTAALNDLRQRSDGSPRNITIAHYRYRTDFDNEDFPLVDIVDDLEACPASVYAESAHGSALPKSYVSVDSLPQPGTAGNETAFSAAFRAAAEPESEPQAEAEAAERTELSLAPNGYRDANQELQPDAAANGAAPFEEPAPQPAAATEPSPTTNGHDAPPAEQPELLVLIDLENIDGCLLDLIRPEKLSRRTRAEWSKLGEFAEQRAQGGPVIIKAFQQESEPARNFAAYLRSIGFEAVLLQREPRADDPGRRRSVVDEAICKDLAASRDRRVDILVVSHDGDYYDNLEMLHDADPDRRIGMIGFVELMSRKYQAPWIERIDLERDVHAFSYELPNRLKPVTAVDDYDPTAPLDAPGALGAPPSERLLSWANPRIAAIAAASGQKT